MHYKKRKLHKLHSIPIGLCNKEKLYLVSYSIPLSCMVVLLLGLIIMANPDHFASQKSYAIETDESSESSEEGSNSMARVAPTPTIALNVTSDTHDGYGNDVAGQVTTAPGAGTAYRSHKINITGSNILSYSLKISGPTNLTPSSGASTTISGAGGKTGSSMTGNTWGYAWGQDSEAVEEMTYNTMSTSGTGLSCDSPSSYNVNCERKLVFGANFGVDADPGTYTSQVQLSLTATPAIVTYTLSYNANGGSNAPTAQTVDSADASYQFTIKDKGSMAKTGYNFLGWSKSSSATTADATYDPGKTVTLQKDNPSLTLYAVWKAITLDAITTMQEMTPAICTNAAAGATKSLKDTRDNNNYNIVKLEDGRCWMQQNLRLTGSRTLTSSDSNVSSNWSMPASLTSLSSTNFSSSDYYKAESYYQSGTLSTNGVYYSFTAATAGAATSSVTSGEVGGTNGNSVCPKGWMLPTNSEYSNMLSKAGIGNNSTGSTKIRNAPYSFPYAGYVRNGSLRDVGSNGYYWSRTVGNSDSAYRLNFYSSAVVMGNGARYLGFSVRCVAPQ